MRCISISFGFTFFVLVALTNPGHSGELTSGKYAGEFLALGAGGRSLGMGGAHVAVVRDVTSGYWNPAGLANLDYPQFMLMHSHQFRGVVNYDYGSAGFPVGKQNSLGITVLRVGVDDIINTQLRNPDKALGELYVDENGQLVRNTPLDKDLQPTFSSADYGLFLTYSKRVSQTFSYGGNVKFIYRDVGSNSAWGIGFDLGVLMHATDKLVVGFNLQDVTTTLVAWDTGRRELIRPALRTGVTYPLFTDVLGGTFQPAVDMVFRFENRAESNLFHAGPASADLNMGWEYIYRNSVALRLGFADVGQPDAQAGVGKFSAGIGLYLPKLLIDYAFLGHDELGNTHRISARLTLAEPKFLRQN